MKVTIRLKFLIVMSGLLLVCLSFYLLMSIAVFKTDKTQLVYDLNRSQVSTLSSEIETKLNGVSETLNLIAELSVRQRENMMKNLFSRETDIVSIQVYDQRNSKPSKVYFHDQYLKTYGFLEKQFSNNIEKHPPPFEEIFSEGSAIWNDSTVGSPPLMSYGKLVLVLDENQTPVEQWVIVANLKLDSFIKSVSVVKLSEIQISNDKGQVLVQRDVERLVERPWIAQDPLFKRALQSDVQLSVTRIDYDGKGWLSAYSKAFNDKLIVTARAPEKKVFQVVQALTIRTLLFGSIVLTLVILAAFLLSRSLTQNIAILSRRMNQVSEGDLTSQIDLKGRDETVNLGQAFNKMIQDLKQSRDELEIMNRELDQKVKDRTRELEIQNQTVAEAQEALVRTARLASIGEVAGRTAHEVLNPLTSLLTRAGLTQKRAEINYQQPLELLDEIGEAWSEDYKRGGFDALVASWKNPSDVDPKKNLFTEDVENLKEIHSSIHQQIKEITKDMQFIREEGDRIGKIIHGMRRLGNMKSEARSYSIHQLLTDCSYIMADLFDQQRVVIEKNFSAELDDVKIDRDEFIQSVTNMMRNSLQSLIEARSEDRQRKGILKLITKNQGNKICIQIEDNGVGISPSNQEKLFHTNFTTKSSEEGTGLGLSISRRFIRSYEGDIHFVESIKDQKTVFQIELPIDQNSRGKAVA